MRIPEITKQRWRHFRSIRRAHLSLLLLLLSFFLALVAPLWVDDRPLIFSWDGGVYTPILSDYTQKDFGGLYETQADYRTLFQDEDFKAKLAWSLFPLLQQNPYHANLHLEGSPPFAPSWDHWLGTDVEGRDLLSRLIYGYRNCMGFSLLLTLTCAIFGVLIGGLQGYMGGRFDFWFQRFIEIWSSLPFLYVVIVLGSFYSRGFVMLIFIMSLFSWIGLSYYLRGEFLKLKNQTFITAGKALGLSPARIFVRHILPNALTPLVTLIPFTIIGGISSLTALDFLGFGLNPPTPSWGELISQGLDNRYAPWIATSTVAALFITLLLTAFVGEGVREAFDPKGEGHRD